MIKIVIIVILVILLIFKNKDSFKSHKVCNHLDNRCYKVASKYDSLTHEEASKLLAKLNKTSIKLLTILRDKYLYNTDYPKRQHAVKNLLKRYDPDNLIENSPHNNVNTSYVKNKGDVFALCLREKESGENNFHKKHLIDFVLIHELAHLGDSNWGHGKSFWETFKFLLYEANLVGIHKPVDYSLAPVNYCYLDIPSNPFFNKNIELFK